MRTAARRGINSSSAQQYTRFVDPLIGSDGHGHVFVGASVPFGAVQAGPTEFFKGWDWCSGYHYGDSVIVGFSQTHLSGTGMSDLGDITIMPYTGAIKTEKGIETKPGSGYASQFSHKNEMVKPGFYSVKLDNGVDVRLTASERVAYHRYTFPSGKTARILVDLNEAIDNKTTDAHLEQKDAGTFVGYRAATGWAHSRKIYFAITLSRPVTKFALYSGAGALTGKTGTGKIIKGLISFPGFSGDVEMKVGISPVSTDNALANITAEIPGWNFEETAQLAEKNGMTNWRRS